MDLILNRIFIDWDKISPYSYLREIDALKDLNTLDFHKPITIFSGENGSGKSTLLEAIAICYGFNPEGGTWNYRFSTYDSHSQLCDAMRLSRGIRKAIWGYFLRAESFYNVASAEEEYSEGGKTPSQKFHAKSHGESFLELAQSNFRELSIYFLDEPEAAISLQRQLTILMEIDRCVKKGAQFFIVTHSPILLGIPNAEILNFDDGPLHPITYEETASYQITKLFLENKEMLLEKMLRDVDI